MKLSNTQHMMLASAAGRDDGQLFPLAGPIASSRRDQALRGLLNARLVVPVPATADAHVWRLEEGRALGLVVTPHARRLLADPAGGVHLPASDIVVNLPLRSASSKIGQVIMLLKRPEGVGIEEIGTITGWQPHTVRAALTGLRKKGHIIARSISEGAAVYHFGQEA